MKKREHLGSILTRDFCLNTSDSETKDYEIWIFCFATNHTNCARSVKLFIAESKQ